jgi:hypothetical protein
MDEVQHKKVSTFKMLNATALRQILQRGMGPKIQSIV